MELHLLRRMPTSRERETGLRWLLVYTFFMVAGFSIVIPLVAVHFVKNIGLAASLVGVALALRQVVQQGFTVIGGLLCDRLGAKPMLFLGVLVRAIGFLSLAWASSPTSLIVAMLLSAIGGALFEAPYQASIVALTSEKSRTHYYVVSNWVSGVATTVGPLIGIALIQYDFMLVCYGAALCFLINSLIVLIFLPAISTSSEVESSGNKLSEVLANRRFIFFTALMMGYWFTSVQFNISFPLWAEKLSGNIESVGVMYTLSAVITIGLQYHLIKLLERKLEAQHIFLLGLVVMSLSCTAIGFSKDFAIFLSLVAFFSLGVLMTRPTQQAITASLAGKSALGSYLGFSSLGLAFGGGLGNWLGGLMFDVAEEYQLPALPWVTYCLVGLLSAFLLYRLLNPVRLKSSELDAVS